MKEKLEDIWDNIKLYVPLIIVFLFFIACAVVCFRDSNLQLKQQNAIKGGVKASATIVRVDAHTTMSSFMQTSNTSYNTIYEYIDSDGTKYSGRAFTGFKTRQEAEKYIGTQVEIYIDGKGNSIRVGEKINFTFSLVMGIILVIFSLVDIGFIIWSKIPYRKKDSNNNSVINQP